MQVRAPTALKNMRRESGERGTGQNRKGSPIASRDLNFLWLVSVD